ncbi:MAG: DNA polymerase III subunit beta [Burkholderiales bacterium]
MLLIRGNRDALLRPLQTVSGIVERRQTLPILSNILLERNGAFLSFLATDLEIQISTREQCDIEGSDISFTVGARKLLDILRTLPDNASVELALAEGKLRIKAGSSKFILHTLPPEDLPRLPDGDSGGAKLRVAESLLKQLFALVQYAMAQQDVRYYLNGLLLIAEESRLTAVATDGHRLAISSVAAEGPKNRHELIVPRKAVIELTRLLGDSSAEIILDFGQTQIKATLGQTVMVSKLIDGKFPDYTRVVPSDHQKRFALPRLTLQQALQRVAILASEKFRGVRWLLTENSLKIICTNTDQEEAQEEIPTDYQGEALDIGFNVGYLLDVLNSVRSEQINCRLGNASSSALFTVPDNDDFKYVVMPMRI